MKKIKLSPSLIGLDYARVEIPTPYGDIVISQEKDKKAVIESPDEIEIIL